MLAKVPLCACLGTRSSKGVSATRERDPHKSIEELSIPGGQTGRRKLAGKSQVSITLGARDQKDRWSTKCWCRTDNSLRKSSEDSGTQALGIMSLSLLALTLTALPCLDCSPISP